MEETHARLLPDYFRVAALPGRSPVSSTTGSGVGPSSVILVAEGRGQGALGYVSVNVVETPADPTMTPRRRAHVDAVVVDKAHRGAGVGTALMRAAADWARRREAVELVLTVWSDNEAAEALYRRLGYQPLARVMRQPL
jgi:ribosomal protein S18 acetylase RimI-like enzyme